MIKNTINEFQKYAQTTDEYLGQKSRSVLGQYPMLFTFLVLFGSIATLKGFEEVIIRIPIFADYPLLLFFLGIGILLFTGSLFKLLRKHKEQD